MSQLQPYGNLDLARETVDHFDEPTVLEFGTDWCEYCQAAQSVVAAVLPQTGAIQHLKIEDGKGRPLGRSFQIKLWPTLIFLRQGKEAARVVRPTNQVVLLEALSKLRIPL